MSDEMWAELQVVRQRVTMYNKQLQAEEQAMEDVSSPIRSQRYYVGDRFPVRFSGT